MTTSRWRTLGLMALAILLPLGIWDKRGAVVGLIAVAVYGVLFLAAAFRDEGLNSWFSRHPVVDSAIIGPLVFLALALLTSLSTSVCALIGLAAAAIFVALTGWRRQSAR